MARDRPGRPAPPPRPNVRPPSIRKARAGDPPGRSSSEHSSKKRKIEEGNDDPTSSVEDDQGLILDDGGLEGFSGDDDNDGNIAGDEQGEGTVSRATKIANMHEALQGLIDPDVDEDDGTDELGLLPLDIDFEHLQHADQYNDVQDAQVEPLALLPTMDFDSESEDELSLEYDDTNTPGTIITSASGTMMSAPSRRPSTLDTAEFIVHERITNLEPTVFKTALGMWCEESGISRAQFAGLREIFALLEPHIDLGINLPNSLSTLQRHTRGVLPLLQMKKQSIDLIPEQQPTTAEGSKKKPRKVTEDLTFFDLGALFQAFLSADEIVNKMHIGLAEFRDAPSELFHSHAWASSLRTTSGQYAHFPETAGSSAGQPIFPSEFMLFHCEDKDCLEEHLGMVWGIGRDYRDLTPEDRQGEVLIQVRDIIRAEDLMALGNNNNSLSLTIQALEPELLANEIILSSTFNFIPEANAIGRVENILVDKLFQEPHGHARQLVPSRHQLLLRRTLEVGPTDEDNADIQGEIRPLYQTPPLRGELELEEYGRAHFVNNFDVVSVIGLGQGSEVTPPRRCISVPLLTFIDGFGVYRNSYRSLMGMYVINGALSYRERTRRANVLPVTLGPHGSNFSDVCAALEGTLAPLEKGVTIKIKGEDVFVSVFALTYIGDMPQQQVNAGCKTQRANLGCRFCFISADERRGLDYDIVSNGRFHHQHVQMRRYMDTLSGKGKDDYCRKWGLNPQTPPLTLLSPALDMLLTRPSDPAHSEYQGMSRLMHELLLESILTPIAGREYHSALKTFPFPPGYARLQSPLHHLKSYSLSEHARWSTIVAPMLRCWMKPEHVKPVFLRALREFFGESAISDTDSDLLRSIIQCFAGLAKNNSILMAAYISVEDRARLQQVVVECRSGFQTLVACAASSLDMNPRSRSVSVAGSQHASPGPDYSQAREYRSKAGKVMAKKESLPTVHTGLHYLDVAEEYGLPSNCNTLIGEDKHRWFKKVVYTTNHSNIERLMLSKENFRQTIRLLLLGAFADSEPVMTTLVADIQKSCPKLFETILPRSELAVLAAAADEEDDAEESFQLMADDLHLRPSVIGRIQANFIKSEYQLPTRCSDRLPDDFRKALREAYDRDYGMPNIRQYGRSVLKWCKKLSFHDPVSERQAVFKMGDFIEHGADRCISRIDQIFIHTQDVNSTRRVFLKVSEVDTSEERRDEVLDVAMFRLKTDAGMHFVGLPAVSPKKLYIIAVTDEEGVGGQGMTLGGEDLLYMDWTIEFL